MNRRLWTISAITLAALSTACHSDEPKTIEDVRPSGQVCFPRSQPDNRGQPNGSDAAATRPAAAPIASPTTVPTTQANAHGAPGHWCALCAAAAARTAEQGRARAVVLTSDSDLMSDLPQR